MLGNAVGRWGIKFPGKNVTKMYGSMLLTLRVVKFPEKKRYATLEMAHVT